MRDGDRIGADCVVFGTGWQTDYGYLPIFVVLIVLLQIAYLAGTGTLARFLRLRIYPLVARLRSRRPPTETPGADGA